MGVIRDIVTLLRRSASCVLVSRIFAASRGLSLALDNIVSVNFLGSLPNRGSVVMSLAGLILLEKLNCSWLGAVVVAVVVVVVVIGDSRSGRPPACSLLTAAGTEPRSVRRGCLEDCCWGEEVLRPGNSLSAAGKGEEGEMEVVEDKGEESGDVSDTNTSLERLVGEVTFRSC